MAITDTTRARRLSKAERREQLLDRAAAILLDHGPGAVTMERVAEAAGVSKALPYAHFDNADDLLVELHRREVAQLGARVLEHVATHPPGVARIEAAVHAYFEVVRERGAIFGLLSSTDVVARTDDGSRVGHRFVARLLKDVFPLREKEALAVAVMTQALLAGAVEAWVRRDASRAVIEPAVVRAIVAMASKDTSR